MDPNIFPGAATPQQDQPNAEPMRTNFFDSSAPNQESILPSTPPSRASDILINPQPVPKPKKKWPLLAIVAIILVGVVIGTAIYILSNKKSQATAEEAFAQYSTTINSDRINQKMSKDLIEWSKKIQNHSDKLAKTFGINQETIDLFTTNLSDYTSVYVVANSIASSNDVFTYYIEHKTFDGIFSDLGYPFETDDEYLSNIKANIDQYFALKTELYKAYSEKGCITSEGFDAEKCQEDTEKEIQVKSYETAISDYAKTILDNIKNNISKIENERSNE